MKKEYLEEVDLHEVSVVGTPAYPRAIVKSMSGFSKHIIGGNKMQKDEIAVTPAEKIEVKTEPAKVEPVKVEVKPEVTEPVKDKVIEDKKVPEKEINADKDEATAKAVSKAVSTEIEKFVKTASFDKLVEKTVDKIIDKRAKTENSDKFPNKKEIKDKDIGELGASMMASKKNI